MKWLSEEAVPSGLTLADVRTEPILFGSEEYQNALLEIAQNGSTPYLETADHLRLIKSCICKVIDDDSGDLIQIDPACPALNKLTAVLSDLLGQPIFIESTVDGSGKIDVEKPLAPKSVVDFRVILVFVQANEALDIYSVRQRIKDKWAIQFDESILRLIHDGILVRGEGQCFKLSERIQPSFSTLILRIAEFLADPRLVPSNASARAASFVQAVDGAPRFFGPDLRLRNLMALAVYGPMQMHDLRRITGTYKQVVEGRDNAIFGRGNKVRVWETDDGMAVGLDEQYPLHLPLRRFLQKLAEIYPLGPHLPKHRIPDPPPHQAWSGERLALFGSTLPTSILICLCLPSHWTFEAICSEVATGFYREVVMKTIRRLEEEGVLQGSRPRDPGFGPRLLSLADTCPAKENSRRLSTLCRLPGRT